MTAADFKVLDVRDGFLEMGPPAPAKTVTVAYIVDSETGVERVHRDEHEHPPDALDTPAGCAEFMWSDGNYACDCNREIFFARAGNEEPPEREFCTSGRYWVRLVDVDGVTAYREEPPSHRARGM